MEKKMNIRINGKDFYVEKTPSEKYYIQVSDSNTDLVVGETHTDIHIGTINTGGFPKKKIVTWTIKITGCGKTFNINEKNRFAEKLEKRFYVDLSSKKEIVSNV